jgi:hypothetical protein
MWLLAIPLGLLFGAALARRVTLEAGRSYRISLRVDPPRGAPADNTLPAALFRRLELQGARDILISGVGPIVAIYTQPAIAAARTVELGQPYPMDLDGVRALASVLEVTAL